MPLHTRVAPRAWLVWAMGLLVIVYAVGLALHGEGQNSLVFGWFALLTLWVPAVVCWRAVLRVGLRHWEVTLAAAALTLFAAGETYVAAVVAGGGPLPFPSVADVGFLLYYPLMLAALVVAVARRFPGLASSVWLDSAVGSLGAASVLAALLSPVLDSALKHTSWMPYCPCSNVLAVTTVFWSRRMDSIIRVVPSAMAKYVAPLRRMMS